jgi:hypothetical protein
MKILSIAVAEVFVTRVGLLIADKTLNLRSISKKDFVFGNFE